MPPSVAILHPRLHQEILHELGHELTPPMVVLDFGCGDGLMVNSYRQTGFDAWGCDIKLPHENEFLRRLPEDTNRIPFPDNTFDFVFSDQVLEHVRDHRKVFSEIRRVMKPGAVSLHIFPAKLKPTEAHNFVPLAGAIQNYSWLLLWAFLGIRNSFQEGMGFQEVAQRNFEYLKEHTCYLSKSQIVKAVKSSFDNILFAERQMIKYSYGGARRIYPIVRLAPFVAVLYSTFYTRVIFFRKSI